MASKAIGGGTSRDGIIFRHSNDVAILATGLSGRLVYLSASARLAGSHSHGDRAPERRLLLQWATAAHIYLAVYTLLALLFIAVTHLTPSKPGRRVVVRYDRGHPVHFMRAGLLAALLALVMAWACRTSRASASINERRWPGLYAFVTWTRFFSSLRSYAPLAKRSPIRTLVLGGPRTVGNTLMMGACGTRSALWCLLAGHRL